MSSYDVDLFVIVLDLAVAYLTVRLKKCIMDSKTITISITNTKTSLRYLCSFCKSKQNALKFQEIHQIPKRLVLHLKQYDDCGRKVNKKIQLPPCLDIAKFTTTPNSKATYRLYATVHHSGATTQDGHYYSFANLGRQWY